MDGLGPRRLGERLSTLRRREVAGALLSGIVILVAVWLFLAPPGGGGGLPVVGAGPRVGAAAPALVVDTFANQRFDLAAVQGRPVWINFWASWCPPCRAEMPDIDAVQQRAAADGLVFIAMNFEEPREAVASYLQNTRYGFTVGLDPDGEVSRRYRVLGLPTHVFIARDGTIAAVRVGGLTPAEMESTVRSLLAGEPLEGRPAAAGSRSGGATPADLRAGEALYSAQCLRCHGGPAGDVRVAGAPPHTNDGHTWHHSDDQLLGIVANGSGAAGAMPAFRGQLKDADMKAILAYIKSWWGREQRAYQEQVTQQSR